MCSMALEPFYNTTLIKSKTKIQHNNNNNNNNIFKQYVPFSVNDNTCKPIKFDGYSLFCNKSIHSLSLVSCFASKTLFSNNKTNDDFAFNQFFPLIITDKVEGKIYISLDQGKDADHWKLTIGCSAPGNWILHWGVHYVDDVGSEWDQPPKDMRPPGSIAVKDYAIETPLKGSSTSSGGEGSREVTIDFNCHCKIAAINFVLKDEETGSWYHHQGRDFVVPLVHYLRDDSNGVGAKKHFDLWKGTFGSFSIMLSKGEITPSKSEDSEENVEASAQSTQAHKPLEGFYEEQPIIKEVTARYSLGVSVRKCPDTAKKLVYLETDMPGDVTLHWGVCRDGNSNTWELPASPHPPDTEVFKTKALRTRLQTKEDGFGSEGLFTIDNEYTGLPFVLKLGDGTWLNNDGDDFFIPLSGAHSVEETEEKSGSADTDKQSSEGKQEASHTSFAEGFIKEIRNLVTDMSSDESWKTKGKKAHESILQEIEKLADEAYSMFRGMAPDETAKKSKTEKPAQKICSGTGSGYEILCQGFNWESHKSGRWYTELQEKASELSSLGFTIVWLPPPTESVSPEGYMPRDLYNLNSRYGDIDDLKSVVKRFHQVGLKVLGDVVLNHRCAHFQNQNGIWNIFGGRLNWDDRAVVADDPHFQGRGNKSSGDNFHAAPNIDHSQEFVRNDLKQWLCWLREDIGYDGWRLDFVRGFWGGYVKDYIATSEPYFAVGEYWDSLSYTYGEMDYNQDAHRQRIVDWVGATGGAAGAFDVTTKGILHSVLERCEYWRLSDHNGKPSGVVGWWPSRAVTFIENHDTGSTQGHWRFPGGKEMQGYAYILTHPGTPAVFYDHVYSHYQYEIASLIALRTRKKIHCRSVVKITKSERDVYAAIIDDKVAMKIGPGYYEPPSGSHKWSLAVEGKDYRVWETL